MASLPIEMAKQDPSENDGAPKQRPNAAPASVFAVIQKSAENAGIDFDDVLKEAGVSRQSVWRAGKGNASQATARKISAALTRLAEKRKVPLEASLVARVLEWGEMGARLAQLNEEAFGLFFDRVKKVLDGEVAMQAIRNPLPTRDEF